MKTCNWCGGSILEGEDDVLENKDGTITVHKACQILWTERARDRVAGAMDRLYGM